MKPKNFVRGKYSKGKGGGGGGRARRGDVKNFKISKFFT